MSDTIKSCIKMYDFYQTEINILRGKQHAMASDIRDEVHKITGEYLSIDLDGWDCPTSPTLKCMYDWNVGECCYFCDEPAERK